jgi:hypothetical protein
MNFLRKWEELKHMEITIMDQNYIQREISRLIFENTDSYLNLYTFCLLSDKLNKTITTRSKFSSLTGLHTAITLNHGR